MSTGAYVSWGNYPRVEHAALVPLQWRHQALPDARPMLPAGLGRSYGDSGLNAGGTLLTTATLDRLIAFDRATGILRCEAGVALRTILGIAVGSGWFLPVAPGTAFVTVGGAIANDVHGKNHHRAGSFGHHVRRFELLRSDGSRTECSPDAAPELFRATVGGLGLTGLVTWAELQLRPLGSSTIEAESIRTGSLEEFLALSRESDATHEYTVAWIDALASGPNLGRGVFLRGNHASDGAREPTPAARLAIPMDLPAPAVSRPAIATFNGLYRARHSRRWKSAHQPYWKFLFPLDGIGHWNRLYGRRGFLQHQSVVPRGDAPKVLREMLARIARSGQASFLTVLKAFGDRASIGPLSFARPGITLALDFPMRGATTLALLDQLDRLVVEAGGAIYPAKDARMSPETFRASFPQWQALEALRDPAFSSSFWRRVTRTP